MPNLREVAALARQLERQKIINLDVPIRELVQSDATDAFNDSNALTGHLLLWSGWALVTPNLTDGGGLSASE